MHARALIVKLRDKGIQFEDGLTAVELEQIQKHHSISFPPDLVEFVSVGLPVSKNFPNWRSGFAETSAGPKSIEQILEWPADGILFDVRHDNFWLPTWGDRPESIEDALVEASRQIALAPRLIPIGGHRYLPSEPLTEGNPVLSVMQTDIIYYGVDLSAYLLREFGIETQTKRNGKHAPRRIRFWSEIVDYQDELFNARA